MIFLVFLSSLIVIYSLIKKFGFHESLDPNLHNYDLEYCDSQIENIVIFSAFTLEEIYKRINEIVNDDDLFHKNEENEHWFIIKNGENGEIIAMYDWNGEKTL